MDLITYERVVDLSGKTQGASLTDADPQFKMLDGANTDFEYMDAGNGTTGIVLNPTPTVNAKRALITAVPWRSYLEHANLNQATLTIEWGQWSTVTTDQGGIWFSHYSDQSEDGDRPWGDDGNGYLFLLRNATFWQNYTEVAGSLTLTHSPASTQAGWQDYRAQIEHTGSGAKRLTLDWWTGAVYTNLLTTTTTDTATPASGNIGDAGFMFSCALRAQSNVQCRFRGPQGLQGPKITFQAPREIIIVTAQSEGGVGRAATRQTNTDANIGAANRRGSGVGTALDDIQIPMTDGGGGQWAGTGEHGGNDSASLDKWELNGSDGPTNSCYMVGLGQELRKRSESVLFEPCGRGGQNSAQFVPPAMASRYDSSTMGGTWSCMAAMSIGDGQQPGMITGFLFHQGSANAASAALAAAHEGNLDDIFDRMQALWPTTPIWVVLHGRKDYLHPGNATVVADSQTVRDAQLAAVASHANAEVVWDENGYVDPTNGWPNSEDAGDHPGGLDNNQLSKKIGNKMRGIGESGARLGHRVGARLDHRLSSARG